MDYSWVKKVKPTKAMDQIRKQAQKNDLDLLFFLSALGRPFYLRTYLENGGESCVFAVNSKGLTPIDLAASKGLYKNIQLLLSFGARITPHTMEQALTAGEPYEAIKLLLFHGVTLESTMISESVFKQLMSKRNPRYFRLFEEHGLPFQDCIPSKHALITYLAHHVITGEMMDYVLSVFPDILQHPEIEERAAYIANRDSYRLLEPLLPHFEFLSSKSKKILGPMRLKAIFNQTY